MNCAGSMTPLGIANRPIKRYRVECPVCHKVYAAIWRMLGRKGSGSGAECYVPTHKTNLKKGILKPSEVPAHLS